ncbi:unnamed protein product, partial [Sphacelaria rigidula]
KWYWTARVWEFRRLVLTTTRERTICTSPAFYQGTGRIYDRDFNLVLNVELDVSGGALINDVVVADEFAYFTDSNKTQFYSVPLKPNGELLNGNATVATAIPLGPGFDFIEG